MDHMITKGSKYSESELVVAFKQRETFTMVGVLELYRLKNPEDGNSQLNKLKAGLNLDKQFLQDVLKKKCPDLPTRSTVPNL